MLGVDNYGSDSEDDTTIPTPGPSRTVATPTLTTPSVKSGLNLPPPSRKPAASNSSLSLPPPKSKASTSSTSTQKKTKKILIDLPKLSKGSDDDDDLEDEKPAAKRPRTGGGASALLSMLPAPKKSATEFMEPKLERVLGGGSRAGLVFTTSTSSRTTTDETVTATSVVEVGEADVAKEETTTSMLPPSLLKGKGKAKETKLAVDFFSLGSTNSTRPSLSSITSAPEVSSTPLQLSAAPQIEEFRPPSPTPTDPYPGYYQLPSGAWAAYDQAYYKTYYDRWQKDYETHIRILEKNAGKQRGFEGAGDAETTTDVHAADQLDEARKAREEKKSLTKGALLENEAKMPRMTINPSKTSGVARSRHQLGTMLMEAYMNREALEEKIAQGKRNRKEAGNKYGF